MCGAVSALIQLAPHKSVRKPSAELRVPLWIIFDHMKKELASGVIAAFVCEPTHRCRHEKTSWSMRFVVWTLTSSLIYRGISLYGGMCNLPQLHSLCMECAIYRNCVLLCLDLSLHGWNRRPSTTHVYLVNCRCKSCHLLIFLWWNCEWCFIAGNLEECHYTRADRKWNNVAGVVSARWCCGSFYSDCPWILQWGISFPLEWVRFSTFPL